MPFYNGVLIHRCLHHRVCKILDVLQSNLATLEHKCALSENVLEHLLLDIKFQEGLTYCVSPRHKSRTFSVERRDQALLLDHPLKIQTIIGQTSASFRGLGVAVSSFHDRTILIGLQVLEDTRSCARKLHNSMRSSFKIQATFKCTFRPRKHCHVQLLMSFRVLYGLLCFHLDFLSEHSHLFCFQFHPHHTHNDQQRTEHNARRSRSSQPLTRC